MAEQIPAIDISQPVEKIRKQFERALADIQNALRTFLMSDVTRKDLLDAEREILRILSDTDKYIEENSDTLIRDVVIAAIIASYVMLSLDKPKVSAIKFSTREKALIDYAVDSLQTDLKAVTANLSRQARTVLRKAYTDELKRTSARTSYGLSRDTKRLLDDADIAIIDKAGRKWRTSHYVDVVTNTKLMEAYRETTAIEAIERGTGHAYWSYNPKTTDQCKTYHYKIVKVAPDIDSPYPYYRDLPHIGHPNCRHHLVVFSSFENLPARVKVANGL